MCFYVQYERNAFGTWVAGEAGVNADIYGLTPRSSVRKRRLRRRLRTIAALVVLAVIWLSFSVVRQFAAGRQASTQPLPEPMAGQAAALKPRVAPAKVALRGFPPPSAWAPLEGLPAEPEWEPAPAEAVAEAPFVIAPVPELENTGRHVPFLQASLNNGGPGGMGRRDRGFNGGMGGFGGGFGGGSVPDAGATPFDATGGDERVGVMGRREPVEIAADDAGSNGNNGSNGNHGDGNNGSNGNHGEGNNGKSASAGSNGSNGDSNPGDDNDPPAGLVADEPVGEGHESGEAVRAIPEPGSILLAFGAAAVIARHRRRRG